MGTYYWIGDYTFFGCSGLVSITIPNGVTSIGKYAFMNCTGLASITIPNSVSSIGHWAFYKCTNLTEVDLPNTISTIPKRAFDGCSSLTAVDILPHDESGLCHEWKIDSPLYQDEIIHTAAGYMATLLTGEYVGFNWIKQ